MPRIYDSSQLTQRRAERAIAGGFLSTAGTAPNNFTWGSRPTLGIKDSSILYAVKTGHMTEYTRYDTCVGISPGCPCPELNASIISPPLAIPGQVTGITFTVGSIIVSWNALDGVNSYMVTPYLNGVALPSVTTTTTSYRFTDLQEMQPYTFTVCGVNSGGRGPNTTSSFVCPPQDLAGILQGSTLPVDISPSLNYIVDAGLNYIMNYAASINMGPTIVSRLLYLWVVSVTQAWSWVTPDVHILGTHDAWNWSTKGTLSVCDSILWICSVVDYVTPLIIPGTYKSIYACNPSAVSRVKTAGNWSGFIAAWNVWFSARQTDGSAAAVTTMPTGSANWNSTIVVDGVTDFSTIPMPQEWTRLTVQGKKQGYLTYTWDNVTSTCLTSVDETFIKGSVLPAVGGERDVEIDSVRNISANLTDSQKVQAEFWAGSSVGNISPPLMCAWLWKEYTRCIGTDCSTLMYSLLDLAIHLFEGARVTWLIKGFYMQDRPIQEIRRRYAGTAISSWNGTINGSLWIPYQRANFVTPPFPDFTSGHSNFTKSFAIVMTKWFGATITKNRVNYDNLPLMSTLFTSTQSNSFGDFLVSPGTSSIQSSVPSAPVSLSFGTWNDIAESAGMSRLYGGIHSITAHTAAQTVAIEVDGYINTTWNIQ